MLVCVQALVLTRCALRASRGLHARLVDAVLAAPMSFFDATPAGAIVNRFLQVAALLSRRVRVWVWVWVVVGVSRLWRWGS